MSSAMLAFESYVTPANGAGRTTAGAEMVPAPVILRFDRLRATPETRKRIQAKVEALNRLLSERGAGFELKLL